MAVVLIEGFDHMQAARIVDKGWSTAASSMQTGVFSGQAARFASNTSSNKTLPSTYSTIWVGARLRFATSGTFNRLTLRNSTTATCRLTVDASNHLAVLNSGGTTIATGTTNVSSTSAWWYVEMKLVINGASGSIAVHLNGASEIGTTTGNFGSSNIDNINLNAGGTTGNTDFDDIYVLDGTGSAPRNDYLGDVRVETLYPNSDPGNNAQWTPNSGSVHYTRVNESSGTFPDGDTTYVSNAVAGQRDSYGVGSLSVSSGSVFGLQTNLYARKDDAGTRQIADVIRQGGTNYDGTAKALASTYAFYSEIHNQDPTATNWSISNVNANEYGEKTAG